MERHRDHFSPDCEDSEWLAEVGRRGWIVLTKDAKFRYRQIELQALMTAAVRCFALTSGDATGTQNAEAILIAMPQMLRMIAKYPAPFIATITAAGKVKLLLTRSELLKKM